MKLTYNPAGNELDISKISAEDLIFDDHKLLILNHGLIYLGTDYKVKVTANDTTNKLNVLLGAPNESASIVYANLNLYLENNKLYVNNNKVHTTIKKSYLAGASADTDAGGYLYFASIKPESWTNTWHIKYRLKTSVDSSNTDYAKYSGEFIVDYWGTQNKIINWLMVNNHSDTSFRSIYYHALYLLNNTGYNNNLGHLIGERLLSAKNPTIKRNFEFEIISTDGCTISFFDEAKLFANISNTSGNYQGRVTYEGINNGLRGHPDNNDTQTVSNYYSRFLAGANGILLYSLVMLDSEGKWQSFTTTAGTGTSKTKNTDGFRLGKIFYCNSNNVAANAYVANNVIRSYQALIDLRYTLNCGTTLIAYKPIYIVGTMKNGLFYLDDTWWTQTEPTTNDGKIYIFIGSAYTDTNGYRSDFMGWQGAYKHNGTSFLNYVYESAYSTNTSHIDGLVKSELLTSFANHSNGLQLSVTVGGTTKLVTPLFATTSSQVKNTTGISNPNNCYSNNNLVLYNTISSTNNANTGYAGTNVGFPVSNNANGILWIGTHTSNYGHQLGFSSNGRVYQRYISAGSFPVDADGGSWKKLAFTSDIPSSLPANGGNSTTSAYPLGFNSRNNTFAWGTLGNAANSYTKITDWATTNGSEISFAEKSGLLSVLIDGYFYQREGNSRVADLTDLASYLTISTASSTYLPLSGGTLTGALKLANNIWNNVGDDAALGDCNQAGHIGIKSLNQVNPGIAFYNNTGTSVGKLTVDGTTLKFADNTVLVSNTTTSANVDSMYSWYSGITGTDSDKVINKWNEIISFLANIEDDTTLENILGGYLPRSGSVVNDEKTDAANKMTGSIWFDNVDGIKINSHNTDRKIWEIVGNSGSYASTYGFHLLYKGTASGNNNTLELYSHNLTGNHVKVSTVYLDGTLTFHTLLTTSYGATHTGIKVGSSYINSLSDQLLLLNTSTIRFGGDTWDWNVWAGLKYDHTNKVIYLGLADGTVFTANTALTGGIFKLPGINTIDLGKTTNIKNLPVNGGIYWDPYVESTTDGSDVASITLTKGYTGSIEGLKGSVLKITLNNDKNDTILFVTNALSTLYHNENPIITSANYNNYTVTKTGTGASGTWEISISGTANTANTANALSRFTSGDKDNGEHDANNINSNGIWYYTANGPATSLGASTNDGALYSLAYNTSWVGLIAQDYRNGNLFVRGKNNGTWQSWKKIACTADIPSKLPANGGAADTLTTSRTIWGLSFNGSANVTGNLSSVGNITPALNDTSNVGSNSSGFRYGYFKWLGARSSNILQFGANNSTHMTIDTNGNVGIGLTSNIGVKLHVEGDSHVTGFHRVGNCKMVYDSTNKCLNFNFV